MTDPERYIIGWKLGGHDHIPQKPKLGLSNSEEVGGLLYWYVAALRASSELSLLRLIYFVFACILQIAK